MEKAQKPLVFQYLDLSAFLADYYSYRKATSLRFSYESWSQELEVKNKSFLRLAVIGKKKISPALLEKMSAKMFDQKNESEYFYYLVKHAYSATQKEKQDFSSNLIRLLKNQSKEEVIENYSDFLSTPWLPRLLTLLSFKDITPTSKNFSRLLDKPQNEVEILLKTLTEIGLAKTENIANEIHWLSSGQAFKVPDKNGSEVLLNYHRQSLNDAIKAFDLPKNLRRYRSLLLAMNEEQLNEFYKLLEEFATDQKIRFNSDSIKGKSLFQANFNIHMVTKTAE